MELKYNLISYICHKIFYNKTNNVKFKVWSLTTFITYILFNSNLQIFYFNTNSKCPYNQDICDILYDMLVAGMISYIDCSNDIVFSNYFYIMDISNKLDIDMQKIIDKEFLDRQGEILICDRIL